MAIILGAVPACGIPAGSRDGGSPAPVGEIHNGSDARGGTLRFANSGDWDSLDPADTYYTYSWNFARLYGRALLMFKPAPGQGGAVLVPDLAESFGRSSDDSMTWTYTLRAGVKFEDGTSVTSRDVKYAVERSLDKTTFPNGPTYLNDFLDVQGYSSPYKDLDPAKLGLRAVETPDDRTIVFKLRKPYSGFDYLAQLPATIPVPRAWDRGAQYKEHVVSSGPYMFERVESGKGFSLIRNPQWSPLSDPNRAALPDRIEVLVNVNADDIDNRLLFGDLDVAVDGAGVQPAAQGRILADPTLRTRTDSALSARLSFAVLNSDVQPLNDVHCRRAVLYAADKTGLLRAQGGEFGGEVATNLMPPVITGAERFDLYPTAGYGGDIERARSELRQCGRPDGFTTNISYRAELPREKASAESLEQSLAKAGINVELRPFPLADYIRLYAGKPDYAEANSLGIMLVGWAADWPDGYGFLAQIVDSRVIRPGGGNTNLGVRDQTVDQLLDKAVQTGDAAARQRLWVDIDRKVMEDAFILPGVWAKGLFYRPPQLTNVFVTDGFQMYDYVALGTTKQ